MPEDLTPPIPSPLNASPAPSNPGSSKPKKPGKTGTRLLRLGERWASETTKIAGFVESTKALLERSTSKSEELTTALTKLEAAIAGLSTAVGDLKTSCKKRRGVPATLEWAYEKAKESPQTFLTVALVIITILALAGAFGWNMSKHLGFLPQKSAAQQVDAEKPSPSEP